MDLVQFKKLIVPDLKNMKFVDTDQGNNFVKMEVRDQRTLESTWKKFGLRLISCCAHLPNYYWVKTDRIYGCVSEHEKEEDCLFAEVLR
ncbi:MAG: hypothetical protein HeimC2_45700 [Candidatus Heimdallarchaeota archaeon LC_2]|nr:MAG: hypothetical protein HeimC2_45700 [Candidatus Heimdallarchaeota archaeon LC_2]